MSRPRLITAGKAFAGIALMLLAVPALSAQAWLPPEGEGTVSLAFQSSFIDRHLGGTGIRYDFGKVRSQALLWDTDLALTPRFAVTVGMPYVTSVYRGEFPHIMPSGQTQDDGHYHGTVQDIQLSARYNLRMHPLVITPYIGVSIPSHKYVAFAHTAVGQDLKRVYLGFFAGRQLPRLPRAYFQTRYSYAVVQQVDGIRPNHSNFDLELGYLLSRRWSARYLQMLQITHSGYDLEYLLNLPDTPENLEHFLHHDQTHRANFLNLGGGVAYSVNESLTLFGSGLSTAWGENGHAIKYAMTIGASWNFHTRWARGEPESSAPNRGTTPSVTVHRH